jgi:hypothetical protein
MASWTWLRHAPWGEIAKAASRVPEFVRDLRNRARDDEPAQPVPPGEGEDVPDAARLRFEIELLKTNLERLRSHSEQQAKAQETQSRQIAESFAAIAARERRLTWLATAALIVGVAALVAALLK